MTDPEEKHIKAAAGKGLKFWNCILLIFMRGRATRNRIFFFQTASLRPGNPGGDITYEMPGIEVSSCVYALGIGLGNENRWSEL